MGSPLRIFVGGDDLSVAHVDDAITIGGGLGVVGDHEDGLAEVFVGLAKHVEDDAGTFRIEVAGGFVGEHDGGTIDESAGERDALLLSAGKFVGAMLETLGDAEHLGDFFEERRIGLGDTGDINGDLDVRAGAEGREKIEFLKDESDLALAQTGALAVGERGEIDAIDGDASGIGAGESAEQVEERGLAAAGRADDSNELSSLHGEGNTAQGGDIDFADAVGFAQIYGFNEGRHPVKTISQENRGIESLRH